MRLLVTRPQPDADKTARKLQTLGHSVITVPLLETRFSSAQLPWYTGMSIAVTSRNGARSVIRSSNKRLPFDTLIFAVGDATRDLLVEAGFSNVMSANGDVNDLIELIGNARVPSILYVAGRDRSGDLENVLRERGIEVKLFEGYYAEIVDQIDDNTLVGLSYNGLDGVLLYSPRTAKIWNTLLSNDKLSYLTKKIKYFCLAKSVASVLDRVESSNIWVAAHPSEKSLFELIDKSNTVTK